jgi:hypothetical protein
MVAEGLELAAYKRAVEEIGQAGWTTCQLFIQQRVKELMLEITHSRQFHLSTITIRLTSLKRKQHSPVKCQFHVII